MNKQNRIILFIHSYNMYFLFKDIQMYWTGVMNRGREKVNILYLNVYRCISYWTGVMKYDTNPYNSLLFSGMFEQLPYICIVWSTLQKMGNYEMNLAKKTGFRGPATRKNERANPHFKMNTIRNIPFLPNTKNTNNQASTQQKHMSQPKYIKENNNIKHQNPSVLLKIMIEFFQTCQGRLVVYGLDSSPTGSWFRHVPTILHYWGPVTFQGKTHCCLTSGAGR